MLIGTPLTGGFYSCFLKVQWQIIGQHLHHLRLMLRVQASLTNYLGSRIFSPELLPEVYSEFSIVLGWNLFAGSFPHLVLYLVLNTPLQTLL